MTMNELDELVESMRLFLDDMYEVEPKSITTKCIRKDDTTWIIEFSNIKSVYPLNMYTICGWCQGYTVGHNDATTHSAIECNLISTSDDFVKIEVRL